MKHPSYGNACRTKYCGARVGLVEHVDEDLPKQGKTPVSGAQKRKTPVWKPKKGVGVLAVEWLLAVEGVCGWVMGRVQSVGCRFDSS